MEKGRLDSVSVAGIAVFSALATLLGAASQAVGLNFPLIPYLQFDLGEVAILMAFFIFGPLPAGVASFVEFLGLEVYGQNLPLGPILKLIALLSTVAGMWVGAKVAPRVRARSVGSMVAVCAAVGSAFRAALMTLPNFYILVFIAGNLGYAEAVARAPFALLGLTVTDANALALILAFTAAFNVLQLAAVSVLSYAVLTFPPMARLKVGGRPPWFVTAAGGRDAPAPPGADG